MAVAPVGRVSAICGLQVSTIQKQASVAAAENNLGLSQSVTLPGALRPGPHWASGLTGPSWGHFAYLP